MNLIDIFGEIILPDQWKYLGQNHTPTTNENGKKSYLSVGLVFYDPRRDIKIRLSFIISTERYILTEKDAKGNYKTRCDFSKNLISNLNEWIKNEYQ